MPPSLSVIIPCLNENSNIARYPRELLEPLDDLGLEYEIIFSDGGSADGTLDALEALSAHNPRVKIIRPGPDAGFGGSLAQGISAAAGTYIAALEADLSFAPADIARLMSEAESSGADCVTGSPFLGRFSGIPVVRLLLTYAANFFLRTAFDRRLTSYTQIFRLYKARRLKELRLKERGFSVDAEILARLIEKNAVIMELPVTMTARSRGRSKLKVLSETVNYLKLVWRIKISSGNLWRP